MAQLFTDQSVYFCISNCRWNLSPVEFAKEASHFEYKLWENHDLTVQPVITYIYLCWQIYASCLSYFSNLPSGIEQKLNWNVTQALEKPYNIGILSYTDSWCLVPFSNNTSCNPTHKVCLCFGYHNQKQCDIWVTKRCSSLQRGTQQENSATKSIIISRSSCNSNAWQSEWGFTLECVDQVIARLNISLKEMKGVCCLA